MLDLEKQLQYSAGYHNPWALKHLAIYYSENKRRSEARELFEEAMKSNYGAAFYEAAVHMHKKGSSKWFSLMNKASELWFPLATYELALISEDEKEKRNLIEQCRQQIFSEKNLKSDLLKKINEIAL